MSGRQSRDKGNRGERELARLLGGVRVPLSGAAGGRYSGDVDVPGLGRGECKWRADGFKTLRRWLEGKDFLALRSDGEPWLVVMEVERVRELLERAGNGGRVE